MFYAGIGSRKTPKQMLSFMKYLGSHMHLNGYTLRSGAADGADSAFEIGCNLAKGPKEIFLPWNGFNGRFVSERGVYCGYPSEAIVIARDHHPRWSGLSPAAKKFHTRNVAQVLGRDLQTHSSLVICWTPEGKISGGTGQALRIANSYKIPILNLGEDRWSSMDDILNVIKECMNARDQ